MELRAAMDDPANEIGTTEWARASSDEGLEFHLEGIDPGQPSYQMASRELARREAARSQALQLKWIKRAFWTSIASLIVGAAAIAATLIT